MSADVVSGHTAARIRRAMSSTVERMAPTGATRRRFGNTRTSSDRREHPDEITADLATAGFRVADVRDAPDRPGREWIFIAERTDLR